MESPEIGNTLDEIENMASSMASIPEDHRIVAFKSVDPLFLKLEGHLKGRSEGRASALLDEIRTKVILMARLDDNEEDSDAVHLDQIGSLIDELRTILCA